MFAGALLSYLLSHIVRWAQCTPAEKKKLTSTKEENTKLNSKTDATFAWICAKGKRFEVSSCTPLSMGPSITVFLQENTQKEGFFFTSSTGGQEKAFLLFRILCFSCDAATIIYIHQTSSPAYQSSNLIRTMCKAISPRPVPIEINPLLASPAISAASGKETRKKVSFYEKVDVYVIDRLDPFAVRELFYRPADFRRFRSESSLEILEAESGTGSKAQLTAALQAVLSICLASSTTSQQKRLPPAIATCNQSYQRESQIGRQRCRCGSPSQVPQYRLSSESLLRELAFSV